MNRKKKINRQSNYDLLRIISTFAVVLIHVNGFYIITGISTIEFTVIP